MSDLMYLTEPVAAEPRPILRPGDKVVQSGRKARRVSTLPVPGEPWKVSIGEHFWDSSDRRVITAANAGDYLLSWSQECLDGRQVNVPTFGLVDIPQAGFAVGQVNDVMGLKVYNDRGGYSTVVAQSSVLTNPWVVLDGASMVAKTVPWQMISQNWHTKRKVPLIEAYLGVHRPKTLKVGTVLQHGSQYWVVEKLSAHHVMLFSIEHRSSVRVTHRSLARARVLGSKRTVEHLKNDFTGHRLTQAEAPMEMQNSSVEASVSLVEKLTGAIEGAHLMASAEAQDLLEQLAVTGSYLLDRLDLLIEPVRSEAQTLVTEHLVHSLHLFESAQENSLSAAAKSESDVRLVDQLRLISTTAERYRSAIEAEVARRQQEHSLFLDAKLRQSDLD